MTTTAVVKHFDIFEQIGLRVLVRPVARGVNPFVFQAVEEAFRREYPSNFLSGSSSNLDPLHGGQLELCRVHLFRYLEHA
jgi:hypothetical protein